MTYGRIDVHSHLLPGIDDGCKTLSDSLECARVLVSEGYTHSFVTPHVWPSLPENTMPNITEWATSFQLELEKAKIPLRVMPGGEINLRADTPNLFSDGIVTYLGRQKYVLFDLWAETLPKFFAPTVKWLQSLGLKTILAHPERMRAVQLQPELADTFEDLGLLLQGNLQCLADAPHTLTRRVAEGYLQTGRYFMLGSDLHNPETLDHRMKGLQRTIDLVGEDEVWTLTRDHPRLLIEE